MKHSRCPHHCCVQSRARLTHIAAPPDCPGQEDLWGEARRNAEALAKPTCISFALDDKLIEPQRVADLIELLPKHPLSRTQEFPTGG